MRDNEGQAVAPEGERPATRTPLRDRSLPINRLEAFSDGVFAIAITLLVLELHVPEGGEDLLAELAEGWAAYLGYLVSFSFIGGAWIAHTGAVRFIKAADGPLMRLNLLLLLFVSLLPFTTSVMATSLQGDGQRVGAVLFGANLTLATLMVNLLIAYAARQEVLAHDDLAEEELLAFEKERRTSLLVLALATAGALVLPRVAVFAYLVVSVFFLVEPLWRTRRRRRSRRPA
jgi:uncharacterized membrane protein